MILDSEALSRNALEAEVYLKALSNKSRLMILCALMDSELSVGQINKVVDLSQSALSQHLAKLRELGYVSTRKESQVVFYRVADSKVRALLESFYRVFCAPDADD